MYGLGAVLIQKQFDESQRAVVYASRALTPTEQRYAQIEKDALALIWACEWFKEYLLGTTFHLHTNHKPLVPILGSKSLDTLPVRVQRFRMRLMSFQYSISHIPGKDITTADALSRAPTATGGGGGPPPPRPPPPRGGGGALRQRVPAGSRLIRPSGHGASPNC